MNDRPAPTTRPEPFRLAIVGGGPRATYVLERLSADAAGPGHAGRLEVRVYERTGEFGAGQAHSPTQPATSFLNRIAGQVSFAADESMPGAGPLRPRDGRPTLHEWCRLRFAETGEPDFDLGPEDWPKRYVHGLALQDRFTAYVRELRAHGVPVRLCPDEVVDVARQDAGFEVRTAAGERHRADHVLLVTGHGPHDPERSPAGRRRAAFARRTRSTYLPSVYPLATALSPAVTGPGTVVGCAGMGLTAIDVVLHLTEGRGGSFVPDARHGLRYVPSGREPSSIVAFSDAGMFTFARPHHAKEQGGEEGGEPGAGIREHQGVFFTREAVDRLRASVGTAPAGTAPAGTAPAQLDFDRDVLPLVVLEMAQLHYATLFRPAARFLAERSAAVWRDFLDGACTATGSPDDPERLLGPLRAAVAEIGAVLERVLAGKEAPAAAGARVRQWPVEATLAHWTGVVFGDDARARLREAGNDPAALQRGAAAWRSPWQLDESPTGNRFSWHRTIAPVPRSAYATPGQYRAALLRAMATDRVWARQGNADNPHKAATDGVWRDLRSVLSYAVDDAGLTASSHRAFLARHTRHHNRLANGAAVEVMTRIEALARHGLLDLTTGPGATVETDNTEGRFRVTGPATGAVHRVDTLVDARIHPFDPRLDSAPLFRRLTERGLVRLWRNESADGTSFEPGGLDLTAGFHPVRADGSAEPGLTVLGPAAEGRRSFLLSALRPDRDHYVMRDVINWLDAFREALTAHHEERECGR
ncbi:FAD/NAD(P)-binding protein [Streptomyces decoyicus]|uniref:FAD/NAD(P)-binding protein n=1 Tax=Streptomyces decoyicus TaxID=249567 RepID=UPI002E18E32C